MINPLMIKALMINALMLNPMMSDGPAPGSAIRPGVVGVLMLRVWMDGPNEESLRIRIVGRPDATCEAGEVTAAATIEDAVAFTSAWLRRFPPLVASDVTDPGRTTI